MRKRTIPAILPVLCSLITLQTFSQLPQNVPDYLKQRFLRYVAHVPREEVYIHSDRETYIAGEVLWFKVYVIDRQSLKPSRNSRIAYFELFDDHNRSVLQKKILLDEGSGPGQVALPDTLSTGTYTIRAYTSWMKNFMPENCFLRKIAVYNTSDNEVAEERSGPADRFMIKDEGRIVKTARYSGVTLQADYIRQDSLKIVVFADHSFRERNRNLCYIFIQAHGNISQVSAKALTGDTTTVIFPVNALDPGINQVTLFDGRGIPACEKYIYKPVNENDFFALHVSDSFGLRDSITLDILPGKESSETVDSANLSISVAPLAFDSDDSGLRDYLVFGTEFGALRPDVVKNFSMGAITAEMMDSILQQVSSNWIDWQNIMQEDLPEFKFPMEKEDHILTGRLIAGEQQAIRGGEVILLCVPGKEAGFQYTLTDSEGNFSFRLPADGGLTDLVIMPDVVYGNQKITIQSSFSDQNPPTEIRHDSVMRKVLSYISKWSVNYQVSKIYGVSSLGSPLNQIVQPLKPVRFYGKPDIELIMADYIKLPVMEEVFFELLPNVSLRKKKNGYAITITDRVDNSLYITSPALMIDGIMIKDPSLIIDLDPEIVEKIDVIKGRHIVGNYIFPGLVNVITKAGDFSCVSLPGYMIRLPYQVTDPVYSFDSPEYPSQEMINNRIPDYRTTLFWNPMVRTGKKGTASVSFWSSDNRSDYVLNIQGITQAGEAISIKKIIRVR